MLYEMQCQTHKSYKARRKPRTSCEACWIMYIIRHFLVEEMPIEKRKKSH